MDDLAGAIEELAAAERFSGAVRVDRRGEVVLAEAYGFANRGEGIRNTVTTRFGLASGAKGLTATTIVSLIVDGTLELSTRAREILGGDLPLIGDDVTIEHLLAHRSGIGDYLDEGDGHEITDYVMTVPVHELASTEQFLAVLDGFPPVFAAGERFAYCNGGYVVLALIAERAAGVPYHDLVRQRVCEPAGMADSEFLRSDELPGGVALGYLHVDGLQTNVLHLPVRGTGDGGIYSTLDDVHSFWQAFLAGRIVPESWVGEMIRARSEHEGMRYGLGFWLDGTGPAVQLEGYDAGVSFRSIHDPESAITYTVISNTSEGAWPIARLLARSVV